MALAPSAGDSAVSREADGCRAAGRERRGRRIGAETGNALLLSRDEVGAALAAFGAAV